MITTPVALDVPLRTDADGVIRVGNTRVTLMTVVTRYRVGDSPEEIQEGFPTVALAYIYAVIAYYLAHQNEVDRYISETEAEGERLRQEFDANNPSGAARKARMKAMLDKKRKAE